MTETAAQEVVAGRAGQPLVEVRDLVKHFSAGGILERRPPVRAVDGVSLSIARGETVGLVGESGSGKSTLGRLVLQLIKPTSGTVSFDGTDLGTLSRVAMTRLRSRMQLVFQDPVSSFNPRMTIEQVLTEPMVVHRVGRPDARRKRCLELLDLVGLPSYALDRYPHQFSGGQAQRIGIARALATNPDLVVCDEAVSALDVSVQAQVLNLLKDLQRELGLSYLFIAHDLNVVRYMSDRICVMYLGRLAEVGDSDAMMSDPRHPYTQALVAAIPSPDVRGEVRVPLSGEIPSPSRPPTGCRFHTRCARRFAACDEKEPQLRPVDQREVACHLYDPAVLSSDTPEGQA